MLINEAFFVVCVIKCASQTEYNPMNFVTFLRQLLFLYPSKFKNTWVACLFLGEEAHLCEVQLLKGCMPALH
ncbi:hypothetical protein AT1219_20019 [Vibrio alginolyticus]